MIDNLIQSYIEFSNLDRSDLNQHFVKISKWAWDGQPDTDTLLNRIVNREILKAPIEVCLTSSSEYIRECKKYYLKEQEAQELWLKHYEMHKTSKV